MESGESQYAFKGRRVLAVHRLGFEPKPNLAPSAASMQYSERRAKAIMERAKGRTGGWEQVVPFDYKYETVWTDQKPYSVDKWMTIRDRLAPWAGALGRVLESSSVNPDVMQMLRSECEVLREDLRTFLELTLRDAHGWAASPRITFGNACFTSQRIWYELLRYAHTAGPVSGLTLLETLFGGGGPEQERIGKAAERQTPEDFIPLYDAAHGTHPTKANDGGGTPEDSSAPRRRRPGGRPPLSPPGGRPQE